jgi:DNA-binding transcriptional MerR regulator
MAKATEAFRNIGEVSAELGVRKHVLRFWEAKFPQLKPMKRGGGRRYYRPGDVQLLRGIKHLLQTCGYTIKGVQKILREDGVEDVKRLGSSEEAARGDFKGARLAHAAAGPADGPRQLDAAQISALRAVATELESVLGMLGGRPQAEQAGRRTKRAAARA